jgi:hypothetical protein
MLPTMFIVSGETLIDFRSATLRRGKGECSPNSLLVSTRSRTLYRFYSQGERVRKLLNELQLLVGLRLRIRAGIG